MAPDLDVTESKKKIAGSLVACGVAGIRVEDKPRSIFPVEVCLASVSGLSQRRDEAVRSVNKVISLSIPECSSRE